MSPKKVTPVKVTRRAAKNTKHVHKDKFEKEAADTRVERMKVIANLPSNIGLPVASQKRAPTSRKEPVVDKPSDMQ